MSKSLPVLNSWRTRLLPERFIEEEGYAPLWSLLYLGFLFMNWNDRPLTSWLPATLLSIAIFLPIYFRAMWLR